MDNQIPPVTSPVSPQPITTPPPPKKSSAPVLVGSLLIILLAISGLLAYQNMRLQQQIAALQAQPTPTPSLTPTPTPDPTANWKTYVNARLGFELKYPEGWRNLEVPNSTYKTQNNEVWFSHTDFPPPGTGARADIVFIVTTLDPSENWQPKYFDNYHSVDYWLGNLAAKKITGVNKEGLNQESVIIAKIENYYLQVLPNQGEESLKFFDQILSTFKFIDNNAKGALEATVMRSPTCAGAQRPGEICEAPAANEMFKVIRPSGNEIIQTVTTDNNGKFAVSLPAGTYQLQSTTSGIGKNIGDPDFTITSGQTTTRRFDVDTGIR